MPTIKSSPMKHLRGFLKPHEIKEIISHGRSRGEKMLMKTLWFTGARISEIVGLRKQDAIDGKDHREETGLKPNMIYPKESTMLLHTIKRTREESDEKRTYDFGERIITVPESFIHNLLDYINDEEMSDDELIFQITRVWANEIVKRAAEDAGIEPKDPEEKHIHPHHFRHSHAVNFVRKKEGKGLEKVKALQGRLDHKNLITTSTYLQFSQEVSQAEIERIFGEG